MARLAVLSGNAVCRILARHGFVEVRRRGSHVVMQRRTPAGSTTVPVPDHDELKIGTLSMRPAALRVRDLKRRAVQVKRRQERTP
jgi:predicted RNA binding protein YcfA (HicA-like mRNA interferase family)